VHRLEQQLQATINKQQQQQERKKAERSARPFIKDVVNSARKENQMLYFLHTFRAILPFFPSPKKGHEQIKQGVSKYEKKGLIFSCAVVEPGRLSE
jgi:hypothetical protein